MQFFGMELFPLLIIGIWNGWIFLLIFWMVELVLVASFPKGTRGRLFEYDHSTWTKRHRGFLYIGKSFSLISLILLFLTPLKFGTPVFYIGLVIYAIGLIAFSIAVINFRNTPIDEPVTGGIYRYSRNPQVLTILVTIVGISLAVGSGIALCILVVSAIFNRARLIEEEKACLAKYGNSYREYMERVPRYLLINTKITN
ncbi:MAG: methyltransferase family protein [Candidatus Odinarchaeota archaeon]